MNLPSISLWFKEGSSDKVYEAEVADAGNGLYTVNFAYGRRGGTLNTGSKTTNPVSLDEATKIYEKLVQSKVAKGYKPTCSGEGISSSITASVKDVEQRDTGLYPQLLVAITEDEAEHYLTNNNFCAQEKFDGKRMTIRNAYNVDVNVVIAANKKGLSIGFPDPIAQAMKQRPESFVMDGEAIGDRLYAFDLLEIHGEDLRLCSYRTRLDALRNVIPLVTPAVVVAYTAIGTKAKRQLMADLKAANKEGIVFKDLNATWSPGRPESGGPAIKCKFWSSCSCVVSSLNAKRSVNIQLEGQPIGKVTIPPNKDVPAVGKVIEVKYLYVVGQGGSLYQPIYLDPRDDVTADECTFAQQKLKYKPEDEA